MASARNVDFSNVKDGGQFNRRRIPSGDYLATITKIDDAEAKDGVFQYLVSIKINKNPSSVFPYYCKLQENQLWKLRNLLIAGGLTVPKKRFKVDPTRLVGKIIGVTVEDDEYDGKEQSNIAGVFPAAELGDVDSAGATEDDEDSDDAGEDEDLGDDLAEDTDTEEEAEEEAEPEAEAEAEDSVDPIDEYDRTQLKNELKRIDSAFVARKSQTDDDLRALLREKLAPAATEEEPAEDDEDEEEVTPPPVKKTATKRTAKPKAADISDDELDELDIDSI